MGKQVHYVVVADLDSETWWIDEPTSQWFSNSENTWNEDTQQWEMTEWGDHLAGLKILDAQGRES